MQGYGILECKTTNEPTITERRKKPLKKLRRKEESEAVMERPKFKDLTEDNHELQNKRNFNTGTLEERSH
jgi:hypothetical protein